LEIFIMQNDGTWILVQETRDPRGNWYYEDFRGNISYRGELRPEPGGGISIRAGSGLNFHFYGHGLTIFDRDNIQGVFVKCKARLIGTENYASFPYYMYLLCIGGDFWRRPGAPHLSDFSNNNDIGIGLFKPVTPEWQYFHMHTLSREQVRNIRFPGEH